MLLRSCGRHMHRRFITSVTIPIAIKRGPTDLLRALADTIDEDPTAYQYWMVDDPVMISTYSMVRRRHYLLREFGKQTARQLATEWPTLFMYDMDEPRLDAFRPLKRSPIDQCEPNESTMIELIRTKRVVDAIALYEQIRTANVDVSTDALMQLFELVAFYNGRDPAFTEDAEWHGRRTIWKQDKGYMLDIEPRVEWQNGGIGDLLFEILDKNERVYSIMIAGLCKFRSADTHKRALSLFEEMRNKGFKPTVEAYEWLIAATGHYRSKTTTADDIIKLLRCMADDGISPNIAIFEAAIEASKDAKLSKCLVAEAARIGIAPSLSTYWLVLVNARTAKDGNRVAINYLHQILLRLETRSTPDIVPVSYTDYKFYLEAMDIVATVNCRSLADRLVKLVSSVENRVRFPGFVDHETFYTKYLLLLLESTETIDEFAMYYRKYVPKHVSLNMAAFNAIYNRLKVQPNFELMIQLAKDMIAGGTLFSRIISYSIMALLVAARPEAKTTEQFDILHALALRIYNTWTEVADERRMKMPQKMTQRDAGELALLMAAVDELDRAWYLVRQLLPTGRSDDDEPALVADFGYPPESAIRQLFDRALLSRDLTNAANCLELLMLHGGSSMNPKPFINRIIERCELNQVQIRVLRTNFDHPNLG